MKPPKAFLYTAYLVSNGTKQFIGSIEATHATQAKQRIIKMWRTTIGNLEKRLASGDLKLEVYRGRKSPNYYGRKED